MKQRTQNHLFIVVTVLCLLLGSLSAAGASETKAALLDKPDSTAKPLVQIALLLDTSGSMSGMINQAKVQLWAIVNQFVKADRDGVRPQLEVALYQYGSPGLGRKNGFIRQLAPLTGDLDLIADQLFKLTTDGGDEYCGWAIRTAVQELQWSTDNRDYKAIFIVGNEPFHQGKVNFRKSCKQAISKGIIVNTIHCSGGSDENWQAAARLADGAFMRIETDRVVAEVATPYDDELIRLNSELNTTYIGYGAAGRKAKMRQAKMDMQTQSVSRANMSQRVVAKASSNYRAESWDLVDAVKTNGISSIREEELPAEMKEMSDEERKAYVKEKKDKRQQLQEQIQALSEKREAYVRERQKELAGNDKTLGNQLEQAVRKQSADKGFTFQK
jgi:hypothetical protein